MKVLLANQQRAVPIDAAGLRRAALLTLRAEGAPPGTEVSIAVVDDREIRRLNRRYLNVDRPTDVLAFPQDGPGRLLGDVVLSAERASAQAAGYGQTVDRELALLVIHGVLHLLGYDDRAAAPARRMRRRQAQILAALGGAGEGGR